MRTRPGTPLPPRIQEVADLLAEVRARIILEAAEREAARGPSIESPTLDKVPPARLLLRIEEVAETLAISRSSVYSLIRSGELPCVRIGGSTRVSVDVLKDWIRQHESRA